MTSRRNLLAALVVCVALVPGCGSDENTDDGASSNAQPSRPSSERQAADVAIEYLRAVGAEDWKDACAARTRKDRRDLVRLAGSCERALAAVFKDKPVALFEDVRAGEVRIESDKAGVDIVQPGQTEPALTIVAVREDGRWLLEDVPDEQTP